MKTSLKSNRRAGANRGSTVLVVCVMLAILVILVTVNIAAVRGLGREMKSLDKRQQQHWELQPAKAP